MSATILQGVEVWMLVDGTSAAEFGIPAPSLRQQLLRYVCVFAQVDDFMWAWYPCRRRILDYRIRFLKPVLHEKIEIVTLIEHLAFDVRVVFSQ